MHAVLPCLPLARLRLRRCKIRAENKRKSGSLCANRNVSLHGSASPNRSAEQRWLLITCSRSRRRERRAQHARPHGGRRRRRRELSWPWTSSCCVRTEHRLLIGRGTDRGARRSCPYSPFNFQSCSALDGSFVLFLLSMLRAGGDVCRLQRVVGNGVATRWGAGAPASQFYRARAAAQPRRLVLLCSVGARNREGRGKEAGYGCLGDAHATPLAACHRPPALCKSSQRICAALSLSLYPRASCSTSRDHCAAHLYKINSIKSTNIYNAKKLFNCL